MRIVASLTTIPSGVPGALEVIQVLLKEPELDLIYFNLPRKFAKTGEAYPQVNLTHPKVKIVRCLDKGPITKVYPVLDHEKDPETRIFILDDDHLPVKDIVSKFARYSKECPDACLTTGGWVRGSWVASFQEMNRASDRVREVDWVEGSGGIFVPRKFFGTSKELLDYTKAGKYTDLFKKHDDHWMTWHLKSHGAKCLSIPEFFGDTPVTVSKSDNISGSYHFGLEVYTVANFLRNKGVYKSKVSWSPSPMAMKGMMMMAVIVGILTWLTLRSKRRG